LVISPRMPDPRLGSLVTKEPMFVIAIDI
jgi:hypothetical protein